VAATVTKQKALCVATRCTTAQQFIETFHRFCDEQSFFVATMNMRAVGLETPFSIQLQDKSPVLRGLCVVLDAWPTPANPYKRPGIRLGIRRLTPESEAVFYQLQAMRTATPQEVVNEASEAMTETPVPIPLPPIPKTPPPIPRMPTPRAGTVTIPPKDPTPSKPIPVIVDAPSRPEEVRTPGSELILPANPLHDVSDESLQGFVDCTLYEETGNFFRAEEPPSDEARPSASIPAMPPIDEPVLQSIDAALLGDPPAPAQGRPTTLPPTFSGFSDLPIVARTATGELVPLGRTTTGEVVQLVRPPEAPVANETSMKASLQRVETSVMRLLDHVVDTSRPIDAPRSTPMPAGEAYALQNEKRAIKARTKYIAGGGAAAGILAIIIIVAATRGGDEPKQKPSKPVAMTVQPAPTKAIHRAVSDAPKLDVDEEEAAAIAEQDPGQPVVGEGPCRVDVKSTPAGTMVQVDGQTIGPSPITIAGPCAKRRIDLVHPRYKTEMRWVEPTADTPAALDVMLVRPTHSLLVTSQPSGATVLISGRRAGTTPTRIPLMGFTVLEVKVEKKGFDAVTRKIYSKKADDRLAVPLAKAGSSGRLKL
jgi:hypothetical protein